jgi:hydroxymethylbilane synthase
VADRVVDFAVHSLKDVPSVLSEGLVLGCIPKREPYNDVFIAKSGHTLETVPAGSIIGTSSLRRAVQVSRKRQDLIVKPIRGNVETRIQKIQDGAFDGVVLAQAGISRLGLDIKYAPLSVIDFPPSPGQGALGIVCRRDDKKTLGMLKKIEDTNTRIAVEAERALSSFVDSGCRFPVGAFAEVSGDSVSLTVVAYSIDGKQALVVQKAGKDPFEVGKSAADELQQKGVNDLAKDWRQKVEEWNKK